MYYIIGSIALIWVAYGYEVAMCRIRYEIKRRS